MSPSFRVTDRCPPSARSEEPILSWASGGADRTTQGASCHSSGRSDVSRRVKEALINSSVICQRVVLEKRIFAKADKIARLARSILATHPWIAGTSESIRDSLSHSSMSRPDASAWAVAEPSWSCRLTVMFTLYRAVGFCASRFAFTPARDRSRGRSAQMSNGRSPEARLNRNLSSKAGPDRPRDFLLSVAQIAHWTVRTSASHASL